MDQPSELRRVLNVFLASPSDLKVQRKQVHDVAIRLNRVLGRQIGYVIDVHGWEDLPPAYGRPQGQ